MCQSTCEYVQVDAANRVGSVSYDVYHQGHSFPRLNSYRSYLRPLSCPSLLPESSPTSMGNALITQYTHGDPEEPWDQHMTVFPSPLGPPQSRSRHRWQKVSSPLSMEPSLSILRIVTPRRKVVDGLARQLEAWPDHGEEKNGIIIVISIG